MDMIEQQQLRDLLEQARETAAKDSKDYKQYYQGYLDALEDVFEELGLSEDEEKEAS